ncbi:MAG: PKD domain-containing protein, partial [Chitinophagia bacterium]|nr:PKD domain-containing protein [Chitinophagia bacterium]
TDSVPIAVGTRPHATFTAAPRHICLHDSARFVITVDSGTADLFHWEWGDGSDQHDSGRIAYHRFVLPGYFTVTITPSYRGCEGTPWVLRDTFTIDSPMAIPNVRYECTPYTAVTFTDSSWGETSHVWLFGDGTTSTLDSVTHIYPRTPYIFTYYLATYNSRTGCRDTASYVLNFTPMNVDISASDTAVCLLDTVRFFPKPGTDTAWNYAWQDNGSYLNDWDLDPYVTDTLLTPGLHDITVMYTDFRNCRDTLIKRNFVRVGKPADSFTVSRTSGCGPMSVTYTDRSTVVTGTYLTGYIWDFGDGSSAPTSTGTATHTYTAAGVYTVTAIAFDNIGCTDTLIRPSLVTVWRPRAGFGASTAYPCQGVGVTFTNLSSGFTSCLWDFGDGDTSSRTSPVHAYQTPGTYTVRLIVYDGHGCRDTSTASAYIHVTAPVASFSLSDSFTICAPLNEYFYNSSTGAVRYNWSMGDGATSTLTSPTNLYTSAGAYTVTLVATNTYGCKDTAYKTIVVYGYAGAFTYSPLTGCSPLAVHFNASLSNVPNIIWDFADGTTSSASMQDTISHLYVVPGAYVPKLILSDNSGCQSSSAGIDTIKIDAVYPGFTTVPNPVCLHANVTFSDTSRSFFSNITSLHWTFHNGDTSIALNPTFQYDTVGTYAVTLHVVDGWGCTGTALRNIQVNPPPNIKGYKDTVICVGDTASLYGVGGVSYSWVPTASAICATCQPALLNPTVPTTYTVTGTDANGCS